MSNPSPQLPLEIGLPGTELARERKRLELTAEALSSVEPEPKAEWMRRLASADELRTLDELDALRAALVQLPAEQRKHLERREARLRGALFFGQVRELSERRRALTRRSAELQELTAAIDARAERLEHAEARYTQTVAADFSTFARRAESVRALVDGARDNAEERLAREIRNGMQREMEEVAQYLLVARIAIARATDQLALQHTQEVTR